MMRKRDGNETQRAGLWRLLLFCLLLGAPLTMGGTNPDCSHRVVLWGQEGDYGTLNFSQSETQHADLPEKPTPHAARWYGDDMSRLVFYSWKQAWASLPYSTLTLTSRANSVRAWDRSFNIILFNEDDYREFTPPVPCTGTKCGQWRHVRSVDLGQCSIEIPHQELNPAPVIPSPFMEAAGVHETWLASTLLDQVLDALTDSFRHDKDGTHGWAHLKVEADHRAASSWWISTDDFKDEVCMDLHFRSRWENDGVFNCGWHSVRVGICGQVRLSSSGEVVWEGTRSAKSWYTGGGQTNQCLNFRSRVADEVIKRLNGTSSAPQVNDISDALEEVFSEALTLTESVITGDPVTCSNPSEFPGSMNAVCTFHSLGYLESGCVETETPGVGRCVHRIPIQRVENTPVGAELILADHVGEGSPAGLWALLLLAQDRDAPMPKQFRQYHCAAPQGQPVTSGSRNYERLLRLAQPTQFTSPPFSALD